MSTQVRADMSLLKVTQKASGEFQQLLQSASDTTVWPDCSDQQLHFCPRFISQCPSEDICHPSRLWAEPKVVQAALFVLSSAG